MTIQDLPLINACLNGLATVFLTLGFVFIKKGNKTVQIGTRKGKNGSRKAGIRVKKKRR